MIKSLSRVRWLFFLLAAASLIAWHPLAATFRLAYSNDEYTHLLLIVPVSGLMVFSEWSHLRSRFRPCPFAALPLLAISVLIAALTSYSPSLFVHDPVPPDVRLSLNMLALVLAWIAVFLLCLGTRASRNLLFPLCFLLWLVPFPELFLSRVILLLQQGSAVSASTLFSLFGVPVARMDDGVRLIIPNLTIEVAGECSSIRSSLMLLVTTMVLAQFMLHSAWRKTLIIAIAVPLSVVKNGLRIFVITMLGTRVDPSYLNGSFHRHGGVVFFAAALGAIFVLILFLQRAEDTQTETTAFCPVRTTQA
jgi:exosortase